jgi:hypothetical protein
VPQDEDVIPAAAGAVRSLSFPSASSGDGRPRLTLEGGRRQGRDPRP